MLRTVKFMQILDKGNDDVAVTADKPHSFFMRNMTLKNSQEFSEENSAELFEKRLISSAAQLLEVHTIICALKVKDLKK